VSYLKRASVGGATIPPSLFAARLPFMHDDAMTVEAPGAFVMDLVFAGTDERVREITIEELRMTVAGVLRLTLLGADGRVVMRDTFELAADRPRSVRVALRPGTAASRLTFELSSQSGGGTRARIADVRVQGQTPALERYISQRVTFPPP
jgi:hypothetical protein